MGAHQDMFPIRYEWFEGIHSDNGITTAIDLTNMGAWTRLVKLSLQIWRLR